MSNVNEMEKIENAVESVECGITESFVDHIVNDSNIQQFVEWFKEFACKFLKMSVEEFEYYFAKKYKIEIAKASRVDDAFVYLCEGVISDWMDDHSWHSPYHLRIEKFKVWLIIGLNYIAKDLSELEFAVLFNFFDWKRFVESDRNLNDRQKQEIIESSTCYSPENVFKFIQYAVEEGHVDGDTWRRSLRYILNNTMSIIANYTNRVISRIGLSSIGPAICVDLKSNEYSMRRRILIIRSNYLEKAANPVGDLIINLTKLAKKMGLDKKYYYIDQNSISKTAN